MVVLNRKYLDKKYGKENLLNLTEIKLDDYQITKIDSNTFENLNKLDRLFLGANEIEELDVKIFESLSNLEGLLLYGNKLKRIDSNTFNNLTKLKLLWLQFNKIEKINVKIFESLSNLNWLSLNNNKLKRIDSNTFKNLTKLDTLSLDNNKIEKINVKLFESLSNLNWLSLHNNKLKRIDSNTFKNLTKLYTLDLYNNKIEEIDVKLFESLSNLNRLSLHNNKLKRIDSNTFKNLTELEKLSLSDNEIEEIDVRLFERLSNLKELYLHNNKLKEIDRKCFESLKSIEKIIIYENVGLNVLSFIFDLNALSNNLLDYEVKEKVKKYGFISEWNTFLQQFPDLEKQRLDKEQREREEREAASRQKIAEEKKRKAKIEQENVNKPFSSSISSNNQSTNKDKSNINKDKSKRFQDPYIGEFLNDRYQVVKKIGKGSFGSVYLVDDTKIDIKRVREKAMKVMDKLDSATENELEISSKIIHENIVRYFDHFHMSIEGENQTFLITEYCQNGDLKRQIEEAQKSDRNFDDKQLLDWIFQATNALKYLHSKKPDPIIHRDIKPANILLTERNEIKLGDLGLSKIMDNTHASSYKGSPAYMSPEVFKSQVMVIKYYPNTDIWSLGCVLYELKFLSIAFPRGQFGDPKIPSNVSSSGIFSTILPKMLEKDCLVRITSRRLLVELEEMLEDENTSKF